MQQSYLLDERLNDLIYFLTILQGVVIPRFNKDPEAIHSICKCSLILYWVEDPVLDIMV